MDKCARVMRWRCRALVLAMLVATNNAGPAAAADCYDILGCTDRDLFSNNFAYLASPSMGPNCEFLWQMRNGIFAQRGYCFRTPRAIAVFGNEDCRYRNLADVPLNRIERANVATIARAERLKCPRSE